MNRKEFILRLALLSNFVVLVGAGIAGFVMLIASIGGPPDAFDLLVWIVAPVIILGLIGMGLFNIVCLRRVASSTGWKQSRSFTGGLISSGLLGAFVASVTLSPDMTLWMLIPAINAILTITALIQHQPGTLPINHCPKCDYDLRGLEPKADSSESRRTICPECGTPAERGA